MHDFSLNTYISLIEKMGKQGYSFKTFTDFIDKPQGKKVVLRHDVDIRKENSLEFARIQYKMGIVGTYYFRIVPQSFDEKVIEEITGLGHEIGYHYETMDTVCKKIKDKSKKTKAIDYDLLIDSAYEEFCRNLEIFRKIVPVITICMHGSPLSKYDNRAIWEKYDYKKLGIIADPYFDVDFDDVLYLTDTGRRWDGGLVSMRDKGLGIRDEGPGKEVYSDWKVKPLPGSLMSMSQKSISFQNRFKFRSTRDIIRSAEKGELQDKMIMTFHPQRWTDKPIPWVKELAWQNVKNVGKYFLVKLRG
jgi:hypothetical protein